MREREKEAVAGDLQAGHATDWLSSGSRRNPLPSAKPLASQENRQKERAVYVQS